MFITSIVGIVNLYRGSGTEPSAALTSSTTTCSATKTLRIAAPSSYVDLARALATQFNDAGASTGSSCAEVTVESLNSAQAVATAGRRPRDKAPALVLGDATTQDQLRAGQKGSAGELAEPTPVARTYAVVAMPALLAGTMRWTDTRPTWRDISSLLLNPEGWTVRDKPEYGQVKLALARPDQSPVAASLLAAVATARSGTSISSAGTHSLDIDARAESVGALFTQRRLTTITSPDQAALLEQLRKQSSTKGLLSSFTAAYLTEQQVWLYNATAPRDRLQAVYAADGAPTLDLSLIPVGADEDPQREAAAQFIRYVTGDGGRVVIHANGWRDTTGRGSELLSERYGVLGAAADRPTTVPRRLLERAVASWSAPVQGRYLVLVDVSSTATDPLPRTDGTYLEAMQEALAPVATSLTSRAAIGLWSVADGIDGARLHRELVPLGLAGDVADDSSRTRWFASSAEELAGGGGTPATYQAAIDAITRLGSLSAARRHGGPNVIVLVSTGPDTKTGATPEKVVAAIKASQRVGKPVRFITVGFGPTADQAKLKGIADVSDGLAYQADNAAKLHQVIVRGILTIGQEKHKT